MLRNQEIKISFKDFSGGLIYGCLVNSTWWSLHHFDFIQTKKGRKRSFRDSFRDGHALSSNERGRRPDYLWSSDSLEKVAPLLANMSNLTKIVYACVMGVEASGKQLGIWSSEWNRKKFLYGQMYFSHQGVFHHKTLFTQYGMFDESYCLALDYELMFRYLMNNDAIFVPNVIVSAMQSGGMSNTPSNAIKTLQEFARARRKNNISQDSMNYYRAIYGAYVKLILAKLLGSKRAAQFVKFKKSIFR